VFAEYAVSRQWTVVHIGQFFAVALIVAGLIALYSALDVRTGAMGALAFSAAVSSAVALAVYAVLQAVDGVALKQAVDAWMEAPPTRKDAAFPVPRPCAGSNGVFGHSGDS
jgi:hypothetical protein